ncbi:hypothetical protein P171DRAFT_45194 [Karstenula rhodostoma CBS 690.94]|uniref:Extracellular serine-rich protein n=1 Tax=Karstenula rhodostoma CBS 690.94 TaxID=1392251 RepID=A0A9P4PJ20_9PLEO|nr:hypothetical protein P171DRAFT_45194 [Karstenula rhodostoma CBS 690.94]
MAATTQSQSLGFASATATESSTSSPEITSAPSSSSRSSSSDSSLSSSSSSRPPQVYTVKAGAGGFKFDPQTLEDVNVGDIVTFEFYPPDHSVARAEFGSACVPYEYTGKGKTGFWSDTQWVKDVDHLQYYNVTVNSSEPIFFYCAAPASCTDHQMVGVINPNDTQTLQKQIDSAKEATFQVKPGDPVPAEASASLHASATAAPPSTPTPHGHILSGGAIAGIVVGGVAFLALCAALFFYVGRTKSLKEVIKHRESTIQSPAPTNSHFPHSPGYPPAQFSPNMQHAEAGMGGSPLPAYGQHNATDANYYGGYSPQPPQGQGQ